MKTFLFAFSLLCGLAPAYAHKVIGIADGDTLTLLVNRQPLKIRLANIDAPEKAQPFGQRAKQSLSELCWGKDASYQAQTVDRYGRTVAVLTCGGREANRAQVERGMVWVYDRYNRDPGLPALQAAARQARRGLWSDKAPVAPWVFRHAGAGLVKTRLEPDCHTGPRGGRYEMVNGRKRYGC